MVPLVLIISAMVNPVTDSSNVKVTGIGELSVALPAVVETDTFGFTLSKVLVKVVDAVLLLLAESEATPAPTVTSTGPSPVGVISAV